MEAEVQKYNPATSCLQGHLRGAASQGNYLHADVAPLGLVDARRGTRSRSTRLPLLLHLPEERQYP